MLRYSSLSLALLLLAGTCLAHDPAATDPDKYTVLLENARVRVLRYTDHPGEETREHHHPAFVVYALEPFKRQLRFADGRVVTREFAAGDVLFSNGETHVGRNVGDTPTRIIMIELKEAGPEFPAQSPRP